MGASAYLPQAAAELPAADAAAWPKPLGYRHYNDEVVDKFVEKSAENGMDVFRVFDALNDPRNLEHAMAAVKKTGKHAQALSATPLPRFTPRRAS